MAYPDDIYLPSNSKEFGFVDTKYQFNSHWDIVWSFSFAIAGTEHAFSTFLTSMSSISSAQGGQYLGYLGSESMLISSIPYLLTDPLQEVILDETGDSLLYDGLSTYFYSETTKSGVFIIAFDSTGYFALPVNGYPGVDISEVKKNALIIRDQTDEVIFNESLSSLSTEFFLASSTKVYQTLRFRFSNAGKKLSIDFKNDSNIYKTLTSININFDVNSNTKLYPALTFCSPISSLETPSTLFLKNFHTQGNINDPTYESLSYVPLSVFVSSLYTTISGISAYPNY
jgi:hypothetical protein